MAAKSKDMDKEERRELRNTIYTFFYYSNKPIGMSEIVLQFKNYKKTHIEAVLDDLVAKEKIVLRQFSKAKIYYLAQSMEYTINDAEYTDEIDAAQNQMEDDKVMRFFKWKHALLCESLRILKDECAELDTQISALDNQMSEEEMQAAVAALTSELERYDADELDESVVPEEFEKRKKEIGVLQKLQLARKRLLKSMADGISEGMGKKPKELLEEAGIE